MYRPVHLWRLCLGCLALLPVTLSFPLSPSGHHPPNRQKLASLEDTETPIEEDSVRFNSLSRQYWLDLRGTAIRPDEALAFFDEFLTEKDQLPEQASSTTSKTSVKSTVDRIILPMDTFRELPENFSSMVDCLVVEDDSSCVCDSAGELRGSFVPSDQDHYGFLNPLEYLDSYNRGNWVLFECRGTDTDELSTWMEQISSFLQLLPATAAPFSTETPSGLVLPTTHESDTSTLSLEKNSGNRGGVGICCSSREAVFRAEVLLEQVLASVDSIESKESGILLPSASKSDRIPVTSALVLPFDLNLWTSALELRDSSG